MRKPLLKIVPLALFGASLAVAQGFSVGVIGGAPFNDVAKSSVIGAVQSLPQSRNFTVGPALQVNLPLSFRVEVDALFRPYDTDINATFLPASIRPVSIQIRGQQWRFPAMLQYRFGSSRIQPYVGAGVSFGHLSGLAAGAKTLISSGPGQLLHQSDVSPVFGAGVDVKVPFVRVSAELRYTRQTVSNFASFSNLNQAEVLVGIHF